MHESIIRVWPGPSSTLLEPAPVSHGAARRPWRLKHGEEVLDEVGGKVASSFTLCRRPRPPPPPVLFIEGLSRGPVSIWLDGMDLEASDRGMRKSATTRVSSALTPTFLLIRRLSSPLCSSFNLFSSTLTPSVQRAAAQVHAEVMLRSGLSTCTCRDQGCVFQHLHAPQRLPYSWTGLLGGVFSL